MDIRISGGFGFGATSMPMDTFMGRQGETDGFEFGSDFAISVQTRSIAILPWF
jgi:hypothetical protein